MTGNDSVHFVPRATMSQRRRERHPLEQRTNLSPSSDDIARGVQFVLAGHIYTAHLFEMSCQQSQGRLV